MKIRYIKDAPNGLAGTTDDVSDFHGNILVLTGFAEVDESSSLESEPPLDPNLFVGPPTEPTEPTEPKPKTKSKAKATTKTDKE